MDAKVIEQIERLEGKMKSPKDLNSFLSNAKWHSLNTKSNWSSTDPKGELKDIPEVIQKFCGVSWPDAEYLSSAVNEDKMSAISLTQTDKGYDFIFDGKRVLLYTIAVAGKSKIYSLDLLDKSNDPRVFELDPKQGYPEKVYQSLSDFLGTIAVKASAHALGCKRREKWDEVASDEADNKNYDKAIEILNEGLKYFPDEAIYHQNIGWYYYCKEEFSKSEMSYRKALEIEPDLSLAQLYVVVTLRKQGKSKEAKTAVEEYIKENPKDADLKYELACQYALKKEKERMLEALEKAVALSKTIKKYAKEDPEMEYYREDEDFISLLSGQSKKASKKKDVSDVSVKNVTKKADVK